MSTTNTASSFNTQVWVKPDLQVISVPNQTLGDQGSKTDLAGGTLQAFS